MIQPGAKNWISKYFSLVEDGTINFKKFQQPNDLSKEEYLHNIFFRSGIVFGYPIEPLFFDDIEVTQKWALNESTSFLLFESLILIYLSEKGTFDKADFVDSLLEFYKCYNESSKVNIFKWIFKDTEENKLENILTARSHEKKTISNQLWASYMHNSLVYLDIMAYRLFLIHKRKIVQCYDTFLNGALTTVGALSLIDHNIDETEKQILSIYLSSALLTKEDRNEFQNKLDKHQLKIEDIILPDKDDDLYKFYLIDIGVLTIHTDLTDMSEEIEYLERLCEHLSIDKDRLKQSIIIIERFVMHNNEKIAFLSTASSYEKLYKNFSHHWVKILGRSKDKFVNELNENKELIELVNKSFKQDLTEEEKEKVKSQFKDLAKTLPAVAIFMLPGGTILLPIILKIIPNLIPSAFKNN